MSPRLWGALVSRAFEGVREQSLGSGGWGVGPGLVFGVLRSTSPCVNWKTQRLERAGVGGHLHQEFRKKPEIWGADKGKCGENRKPGAEPEKHRRRGWGGVSSPRARRCPEEVVLKRRPGAELRPLGYAGAGDTHEPRLSPESLIRHTVVNDK